MQQFEQKSIHFSLFLSAWNEQFSFELINFPLSFFFSEILPHYCLLEQNIIFSNFLSTYAFNSDIFSRGSRTVKFLK